MTASIREARPGDAEIIAAYNVRLARESEARELSQDTVLAGVRALIDSPENGRYFVAEQDGEVLGQLLITFEWSDWRNGLFWWIQSVYVSATHRREGVFSRLYEHVAGLAAHEDGVCGIRLYVEEDNTRAHSTYRSLGMSNTGYQVMEVEFERSGSLPR